MATREQLVDQLIGSLTEELRKIPGDLYAVRTKCRHLERQLAEATDALSAASLPLEKLAAESGKNDTERKTHLKDLQFVNAPYQEARDRAATIQYDLDISQLVVTQLEESFSALRHIARIEAARLAFLADDN